MGEISLFNKFFSDCRYMPYLGRHSPTKLWMDGAQMATFGDFLRPVFSASRAQHVSDLHLKFAQGHTICVEVWQTSNLRQLRLGEEKRRKKKEER